MVGLVEHGDLDRRRGGRAAVDQVDQPAGGGDHDVHAAAQPVDLAADRRAAVHGGDAGRRPRWPSGREHVGDLPGQLPGRAPGRGRAGRSAARVGPPARPAGPAAAGRRRASCRTRSARGRARPGRPARRAAARAWMAKGALMPCAASAVTSGPGRPSSAKVASARSGALAAAVSARSSSETTGRGAAGPRDRPVAAGPRKTACVGLAGLPSGPACAAGDRADGRGSPGQRGAGAR